MKMVMAIIKPFKLDDVREALSEIGVQGTDGHAGPLGDGIGCDGVISLFIYQFPGALDDSFFLFTTSRLHRFSHRAGRVFCLFHG